MCFGLRVFACREQEFDACMAEKKELQDKACQLQHEVDAWELTRAKFLRNRQSLVKRLKGLHGEPAETLAGLVRVLCASVDGVPVVGTVGEWSR